MNVLVHHLHEIVLDEHLIVAVIDTRLTEEILLITQTVQVEITEARLNHLVSRNLPQKFKL